MPVIFYLCYEYGLGFILSRLPPTLHISERLTIYLILVLALIGFLLAYWRKIAKEKPRLFLTWQNMAWFLVLFIISFLIERFIGPLFLEPANAKVWDFAQQVVTGDKLASILLLTLGVICLPVAEELLFRGIIMETYFKGSPYWLDVLISAVAFAILHLHLPWSWSWNDFWVYLLPSWTLPVLYRQTKSLYFPLIFHILHNGLLPFLSF